MLCPQRDVRADVQQGYAQRQLLGLVKFSERALTIVIEMKKEFLVGRENLVLRH